MHFFVLVKSKIECTRLHRSQSSLWTIVYDKLRSMNNWRDFTYRVYESLRSLPLRKVRALIAPTRRIFASRTNSNPRSRNVSSLPPLLYIPSESYRGATHSVRKRKRDRYRKRENDGQREKERASPYLERNSWRTIAWARLKSLTRNIRIIPKKGGVKKENTILRNFASLELFCKNKQYNNVTSFCEKLIFIHQLMKRDYLYLMSLFLQL